MTTPTETLPEDVVKQARVKEAVERIQAEVDAPVFFERLAHYGITPQNAEEAQSLLKLGFDLQAASMRQAPKNRWEKISNDVHASVHGKQETPESDPSAYLELAGAVLQSRPEIKQAAELISSVALAAQ